MNPENIIKPPILTFGTIWFFLKSGLSTKLYFFPNARTGLNVIKEIKIEEVNVIKIKIFIFNSEEKNNNNYIIITYFFYFLKIIKTLKKIII